MRICAEKNIAEIVKVICVPPTSISLALSLARETKSARRKSGCVLDRTCDSAILSMNACFYCLTFGLFYSVNLSQPLFSFLCMFKLGLKPSKYPRI